MRFWGKTSSLFTQFGNPSVMGVGSMGKPQIDPGQLRWRQRVR